MNRPAAEVLADKDVDLNPGYAYFFIYPLSLSVHICTMEEMAPACCENLMRP